MKDQNTPAERRDIGPTYLEPRVAKLEVGMERLTDDVRNLAVVVREQGSQVEKQIQELIVAVTQASGPKKTDWSTIFAGLMLVFAIGSAVFWPLNQTSQDNKSSLAELHKDFISHGQLQLHPVGMALVLRIEENLRDHIVSNQREMSQHMVDAKDMHEALRAQFQERTELTSKIYELQLKELQNKVDLHNERIYGRVVRLEEQNRIDMEREKDELQMWRAKAMGLQVQFPQHDHTSTGTVPAVK